MFSTVIKGRNTLRLEVDTQSNHTMGTSPVTLAAIPVPLHLGGLPSKYGLPCGSWDPLTLQKGSRGQQSSLTPVFSEATAAQPELPAYRGCMRKLVVNGDPVTVTTSAQVQGTVGVSGCPSGTLASAHSEAPPRPMGKRKAPARRQVGSSGLWQANPITLPLLQR